MTIKKLENPLYVEVLKLRRLLVKQVEELEAFRQEIEAQLDKPQWNEDEKRAFRKVLRWFRGEKPSWVR